MLAARDDDDDDDDVTLIILFNIIHSFARLNGFRYRK